MTLASAQSNLAPQGSPGVERPLLRWDVVFSVEEGTPVLSLWDRNFRFQGVNADQLHSITQAANGYNNLQEISQVTELSEDLVTEILEILYEHKLACNLEEDKNQLIEPETFAKISRNIFPQWKERLFSHSLWRGLATGTATREVFLGWLLEHYHYIEGANDRMSVAVAECDIMTAREHIAHHYTEEYDHGLFLLKCLRSYGFTTEQVRASRPLPSTTSMLNYMRHCGRQGALNYAICSGFLESSGRDRNDSQMFLDALTEHYAKDNPNAIKPLEAHARVDEELGHGNLLEDVLQSIGPISAAKATEALTAGLGLLEILERWSTDIERSYRDEQGLLRSALPTYRPVVIPD